MTRRRAIWLVAAALVVGAIAFVFWPSSERAFYAYLEERRAAGLPTTRDEVRGPAPPPSENAAEDLRVAWEELKTEQGPVSEWKGTPFDTIDLSDGVWPDGLAAGDRENLAKTAERLRPGIQALVRALEKPRLVFPVKFDEDGMPAHSEIRLMQDACRALHVAAATEPDAAGRLAACRALLVAGDCADTHSVLDWMVAASVGKCGVSALRTAVETDAVDAATARAACDPLLAESRLDHFRAGCRGEAVELIETYGSLVEGRAVPWTAKMSLREKVEHRVETARRRIAGAPKILDYDALEPGNAEIVVAVCRYWDAAASAPDLHALTTAEGISAIDPSGLVDATLGRMTSRFAANALRDEAAARLARVALAAAEFRATHGDFPASLDDLKPMFADGVPVNPYSNAPFLYERTATGARIATDALPSDDAGEPGFLRENCLLWELKR